MPDVQLVNSEAIAREIKRGKKWMDWVEPVLLRLCILTERLAQVENSQSSYWPHKVKTDLFDLS